MTEPGCGTANVKSVENYANVLAGQKASAQAIINTQYGYVGNHPCPACGYCPCCGRRSYPYQVPNYDPYRYNTPYQYPVTTITPNFLNGTTLQSQS